MQKILYQNDLSVRIEGEGYVVTGQVPVPGAEVNKNSVVLVVRFPY